jgi:uncharacterized YigZ family protein
MSEFVPFCDAESEFTEKRSHFISHLWRVSSEEEAQRRLGEIRARYHDARHNCWCYRLRAGDAVRYSDDGEPQGTAGQPMLNVFLREDVSDVLCVVTRYFGGILLGAGGLTRAYAKGAKDVLTVAGIARIQTWQRLTLECPYTLLEQVKRKLTALGGTVTEAAYAEAVMLTAELPAQEMQDFTIAARELSAGGITVVSGEQVCRPGGREESK